MSVKFKAIFWHALETAEEKEKKKGGEKELIDLLKDTHILFTVRGRWWTVSWWIELSCGYGSGGDQTWSVMFGDKRPGEWHAALQEWGSESGYRLIWLNNGSCSGVWGDMAGVSVLHSKEVYKCRALSGIPLLNVIMTGAAGFGLWEQKNGWC